MKDLSKLSSIIMSISIVINIIIMLQLINLPTTIRDSINSSQYNLLLNQSKTDIKQDSIKIVTATLPQKGSMVFFEGKMISNGEKLRDTYEWRADDTLPEEIWDGYIHLVRSINGGKYYLWAEWKIPKSNTIIKGWFITCSNTVYGINKNKDYIQIIVPVVRKKELKDGI